jgi:RNA polymerase primary sigma factor
MSGPTCQFEPALSRFFKMAIVAGVENAVRLHIERGDNLNARDSAGQTPLMLAAARNKPHICKLLLTAGADPLLRDPSGSDALIIATAAGAREVALLLEPAFPEELRTHWTNDAFPTDNDHANDNLIGIAEPFQDKPGSSQCPNPAELTCTQPPSFHEVAACSQWSNFEVTAIITTLPLADSVDFDIGLNTCPPSHEENTGWHADSQPNVVRLIDFDENGAAFDLSGWEAEAELATPDGDPAVLATASEVQNAISAHAPIDISADWDDFEAFLPERASPLPKADDAEARDRLRSLLLRAIREGSVPIEVIEDLTLNDDQTPNTDAEALLRMVVNDLGAEADERHEYSTHHENFAVHVEPRESPDEEQTVDDALAFIDELESRRNDPLRIYQRDFQSATLLTADEEIALGKAMEQSIEAALDALADSITAIAAVVESSHLVKYKTKPLRWMSTGTREDVPAMADNHGELPFPKTVGADDDSESDKGLQDDLDEGSPEDELSEFIANAERLLATAVSLKATPAANKAKREALGSLGLSGSFLLNFSESAHIAEREPARALRLAMRSYRAARDRMTIANLKLVQSIAKKYLYSGMPLDDLLQEGNIGLLKSVERFDWRRGFRFSTYATWWIRQQVSRFVADKGRIIRLPVHVYEKTQRITQAARTFEIDNGRVPTTAEIAKLVELSLRKVVAYMQIAGEPLPIHEFDVDSMNAEYARDEYISRDPMDIASDRDLAAAVHKILATLKLKDENILRMRFGIGVPDAMTLDEIGVRMGLTRERIRQIESKAIRKLKHPSRLVVLLAALNGTNPSKLPKNALDLSQRESDDDSADEQSTNDEDEDEDGGASADPVDDAQVLKLVEAVAAKVPRENARKPLPVSVVRPSLDADPIEPESRRRSVSVSVQKLLDAATALGASVNVDKKSADNNIWIDFGKAPTTPPRPLIRKLVDAGFKFWPGKGYWR